MLLERDSWNLPDHSRRNIVLPDWSRERRFSCSCLPENPKLTWGALSDITMPPAARVKEGSPRGTPPPPPPAPPSEPVHRVWCSPDGPLCEMSDLSVASFFSFKMLT